MNRLLPLVLLLAACPPPEDTDKVDSDTPEETDTQVQPPEETDSDVPETDTQVDDGIPTVEIHALRLQAADVVEGDLVRLRGVVVVTVVDMPGLRGFTVQAPGVTTAGGLWVAVGSDALPVVGDEVEVVGRWLEDGEPGALAPAQTRTTVEIAAGDDARVGWTRTGAGAAITPTVVSDTTFATQAELYESMLVRVTGLLTVATDPDGDGGFDLEPPSGTIIPIAVRNLFTDPSAAFEDLGPGATFTAITGLAFWNDGYVLLPRASADLAGYAPGGGGGDTDLPPDTDTDTFRPADTDTQPVPDSDTDTYRFETGGDGGITVTTPESIHLGLHLPGQLLQLSDVVVTAVRYRTVPVASNGFTVQQQGVTRDGGVYVYVKDTAGLPQVGDVVDLVGEYEETPTASGPGVTSLSRLVVHPSVVGSYFTVTSSGHALPAPVTLTLNDFQSGVAAERYESMRVTLDPVDPLQVYGVVSTQFQVTTQGAGKYVYVKDQFYDVRVGIPSLAAPDQFDALGGVLWFEGGLYKLAPTDAGDAVGWTDK